MNEDTSANNLSGQKPLGENLEIEVKFLVADHGELINQLLELGAEVETPRTYERNFIFDNAWQGLARQGKLLRLRQDAGVRITFKGGSPLQANSEVRVREEIEVSVEDFARTFLILEKIGFEKQFVYEKYRETFSIGDIEAVIDEMPFGNFIELEGAEDDIRSTADALQMDWNKRIIDNYLALHGRLKKHYGLPFDDITFDNYRTCEMPEAAEILVGSG
jgi:adenylate cyclase class 2